MKGEKPLVFMANSITLRPCKIQAVQSFKDTQPDLS
jgi:hypothetical protein